MGYVTAAVELVVRSTSLWYVAAGLLSWVLDPSGIFTRLAAGVEQLTTAIFTAEPGRQATLRLNPYEPVYVHIDSGARAQVTCDVDCECPASVGQTAVGSV